MVPCMCLRRDDCDWGVPLTNHSVSHLTVAHQTNTFVFGLKMRGMTEALWELGKCDDPTLGVAKE